jgi:menaquinone-dependent protoporphyrinogen IX oxidase
MKAVIAFDSVYGNTKMVANEVASVFNEMGYESELIDLKQWDMMTPSGDILFVGSPTRMVRMTRPAKRFAKKLDVKIWEGRPVYAFDTIMVPANPEQQSKAAKWTAKGAAPKLKDLMAERGLMVQDKMLRVPVTGLKGPLAETWKGQIKAFVTEVMGKK